MSDAPVPPPGPAAPVVAWVCMENNPLWGLSPSYPGAGLIVSGRAECVDSEGYNDAASPTGITAVVVLEVSPLTTPIDPSQFTFYVLLRSGESLEGGYKWTASFALSETIDFEYGQIRVAVRFSGTHLGEPWSCQTDWVEINPA